MSAGGAGLEDVDPDLHAARTELMLSDQERTPVELAVGVHAASAAAMQNQHMADTRAVLRVPAYSRQSKVAALVGVGLG